jgi:hypothetical protein
MCDWLSRRGGVSDVLDEDIDLAHRRPDLIADDIGYGKLDGQPKLWEARPAAGDEETVNAQTAGISAKSNPCTTVPRAARVAGGDSSEADHTGHGTRRRADQAEEKTRSNCNAVIRCHAVLPALPSLMLRLSAQAPWYSSVFPHGRQGIAAS